MTRSAPATAPLYRGRPLARREHLEGQWHADLREGDGWIEIRTLSGWARWVERGGGWFELESERGGGER